MSERLWRCSTSKDSLAWISATAFGKNLQTPCLIKGKVHVSGVDDTEMGLRDSTCPWYL